MAEINRWFCLQELGRDTDALDREIVQWVPKGIQIGSQDLARLEIGRAALLRNYGELRRDIQVALSADDQAISKRELREMPLLIRAMNEDMSVRALLQGPERAPVRSGARSQKRGRRRWS